MVLVKYHSSRIVDCFIEETVVFKSIDTPTAEAVGFSIHRLLPSAEESVYGLTQSPRAFCCSVSDCPSVRFFNSLY